jgi:hypothetical protein
MQRRAFLRWEFSSELAIAMIRAKPPRRIPKYLGLFPPCWLWCCRRRGHAREQRPGRARSERTGSSRSQLRASVSPTQRTAKQRTTNRASGRPLSPTSSLPNSACGRREFPLEPQGPFSLPVERGYVIAHEKPKRCAPVAGRLLAGAARSKPGPSPVLAGVKGTCF